jgi:AcrR family transcriptional regulator
MGRPSQPIISKQGASRAALQIIDVEGLDAFSLPRLAQAMNVKAPSLYYHFKDKSEILRMVARLVVAETVRPRRPTNPEEWPQWVLQNSLNLRTAILRHRNAAPVLLEFLPRDVLVSQYEDASRYLSEVGIPLHLHVQILDGIEKLSIAAAISEAMRPPARTQVIFPDVDPDLHPALAAATAANELNASMLHRQAILSFLRGVLLSVDSVDLTSLTKENLSI